MADTKCLVYVLGVVILGKCQMVWFTYWGWNTKWSGLRIRGATNYAAKCKTYGKTSGRIFHPDSETVPQREREDQPEGRE